MIKQMRSRVRVGFVGTAALGALLLTACGGSPSAAPSAVQTPAELSGEGAITVWAGSWWEGAVPAITEAWERDHPEIDLTIEPLPINGYFDKFIAATIGGTPPDVVDLDGGMITSAAQQGLVQPLDDLLSYVDPEDYSSGMWELSKRDGVQYGFPSRAAAAVMYFNKTMFDAAGVAYPTDDWTFEELRDLAEQLTTDDQYGFGYSASLTDPSPGVSSLSSAIWDGGGEIISEDGTESVIDSPEAIAAFEEYVDLYRVQKVMPAGTPNFAATKDLLPLFQANKLAMFSHASNVADSLRADTPDVQWGTVLMPGSHAVSSSGFSFAVPEGAPNSDAAKVFVEWFQHPENAALGPRTPGLLTAYDIAPWNDEKWDIFRDALEYGRADSRFTAEMGTVMITELQRALIGEVTADEACTAMAEQITELLNKS
jgi:multiple sugar transport system substrate-binding protein